MENENRIVLEKSILISVIGCLEALSSGCISIDESEHYIFSPRTTNKLNELKISSDIISIIEKGCELEDIESLLPDKLEITISELKNEAMDLLKKYDEISDYVLKEDVDDSIEKLKISNRYIGNGIFI